MSKQKLIIIAGSPCVGKTLKPYEGDTVINTDNKSVQQIVDEIRVIVDSEVNE